MDRVYRRPLALGEGQGAPGEVVELEELADLALAVGASGAVVAVSSALLERHPFRPFDRIRHRRRLDDPVPGDELFRLREGALGHGALPARERDGGPLGRWVESREIY